MENPTKSPTKAKTPKKTSDPPQIIDIFLDPDSGLIEIEGQTYQLRNKRSLCKLTFNYMGGLNK